MGGGLAGTFSGDLLHAIGFRKSAPTGKDRFIGGLFGAMGGGLVGLSGMNGLTGTYEVGKDIGGSIHDANMGVAEGLNPEDQPISNVNINMDFGSSADALFRDMLNINSKLPAQGPLMPPLH